VAYDEGLAQRIREVLGDRSDTCEMRMFGGIAFLVRGNMAVGVVKEDLMVRVGPEEYEDSVTLPHARPMNFTGRPLKGFLYVAQEGVDHDADLRRWIERGVVFAISLPAK
jgi:TfoX/Sxy family transcriptional regulator of competence genes